MYLDFCEQFLMCFHVLNMLERPFSTCLFETCAVEVGVKCPHAHYLLLLYRWWRRGPDLQQCHSLVAVTRFPRNRKPITVSAAQNLL